MSEPAPPYRLSGLPPNAIEPPPGVDPIDLPYYRCSLGEALRRWLVKLTVFEGRAGRAEYWWVILATFVGWNVIDSAVTSAVTGRWQWSYLSTDTGTFLTTYGAMTGVVTLLVTLSLSVRRLHDVDVSGRWLLAYLPVVVFDALPASNLSTITADQLTLMIFSGIVGLVLFVLSVLGPRRAGVRFDRGARQREGH